MATDDPYRMSLRFDEEIRTFLRGLKGDYARRGIKVSLNAIVCGIIRRARHEINADRSRLDIVDAILKRAAGE